MKLSIRSLALLGCALMICSGCAHTKQASGTAVLTRSSITSKEGIVLHEGDRLTTPAKFKPPVAITVVAKTDSTNIRLSYAADHLIFNWEMDPEQLRIDGGPANGRHKSGAGSIPVNEFVTIRWIVTPEHQAIYVNNELRFEHHGDYSGIEAPVAVFPAANSVVTVKSIEVTPLKVVVSKPAGRSWSFDSL